LIPLKNKLLFFGFYQITAWTRYDGPIRFAWSQYIPDEPPRKPEVAQSVKGPFWDRFHTRIWNHSEKSYVGSVHYEKLTLARGHDPYGFEPGKHEMQDDLKGKSWKIEKDKHDLDNYTRKKFGNGKATEFTEIKQQ